LNPAREGTATASLGNLSQGLTTLMVKNFWVFGCGSAADCSWNQLSVSFPTSLVFHSLLITSCSSATSCRKSSTPAHLCRQVCHPSLSQEKGQGTSAAGALHRGLSIQHSARAEAPAVAGVGGADSPARAAAPALGRGVPIRP